MQRAPYGKVFALVIEHMALIGVVIEPRRFVAQESVRIPAAPQPAHHVDKLARALVAQGVVRQRHMPEVEGILRAPRGDHVPPRATAAKMIEGEKLAREIERLAIGRRSGRNEADMACHWGERCEQRDRLELGAIALPHQRAGRIVAAADRELIGHEYEVEFPAFGRCCNVQEVAKIHRPIGLDIRMAPRGDVVAHAEHRKPKLDLCHDDVPHRSIRRCV